MDSNDGSPRGGLLEVGGWEYPYMWPQTSGQNVGDMQGRIRVWARARVSTSGSSHTNSNGFQGWIWRVGMKKRYRYLFLFPLLWWGMGLGAHTAFLVAASHNRAKVAALVWLMTGVTGDGDQIPPLLSHISMLLAWFAAIQQCAPWPFPHGANVYYFPVHYCQSWSYSFTDVNRTCFLVM